tara:strand:+ start:23451 stop:24368 length:918 start_codon:yes stop_codon:yes gene_type:complete
MLNEEQVNEQIEQEVQDEEGNFDLTEELVSFNKGESPDESEEPINKAESDENNEEVDTSNEEVKEDVVNWLIDNKFKDDNEGKVKLADSYKNLQSEYDKLRNESQSVSKEAQDALEFAQWVANNEDARNALNEVVNKPEVSQTTPPEDFDPLDIYTEGTSSNEWYNSVQNQQREQLRNEIVSDVKKEFESRENQSRQEMEARQMISYLQTEHNMSDNDVNDYLEFIKDENSFSTNNLVELYKFSKGINQPKTKNQEKNPESNSAVKDIPAGVNAATAGGSNPPASKDPVDSLMDSLLGNSKRDFT